MKMKEVEVAELGEELLRARHGLGLTQRQVADGLGTSQSAYCRFEKGHDWPSPATLEKMIAFLGLDPTQMRELYWRRKLPAYVDFTVQEVR